MASTITFVTSAPGKLILAGEHSVVHYTRALASVVDKRTFAEFAFTPAESAATPDEDLTVELRIVTKSLNEHCTWTYAQLKAHAEAAFPSLPDTFSSLVPALDATVKPSLLSVPHGANPTDATKLNASPAVFLLYYFGLVRSGVARGSLRVTLESQLPIGAGLGSSASFSSCLSAGFVWLALRTGAAQTGDYLGASCACSREGQAYTIPGRAEVAAPATFKPCSHLLSAINTWAYEGERVLHGNPSGLDNTTCVHGGVVLYRKPRPAGVVGALGEELPVQEGLMRPLADIPTLSLLVVNTRVPRNTAALVAGVGARKQAFPRLMRGLFDGVEELVDAWIDILQPAAATSNTAEDASVTATAAATLSQSALESRAGELMRRNEDLLEAMGVGHAVITRVLALAASHGYAGKLTGAGGGGCVLVLKPAAEAANDEFTKALNELGCEYLETVVGQAGVWVRDNASLRTTPEIA